MKSLGWYRWFAVLRNTGVVYSVFTPSDWMWSRFAVMPRSEPPWKLRMVGGDPHASTCVPGARPAGSGAKRSGKIWYTTASFHQSKGHDGSAGEGSTTHPDGASSFANEQRRARDPGHRRLRRDGRAAPTRRRARESLAEAGRLMSARSAPAVESTMMRSVDCRAAFGRRG